MLDFGVGLFNELGDCLFFMELGDMGVDLVDDVSMGGNGVMWFGGNLLLCFDMINIFFFNNFMFFSNCIGIIIIRIIYKYIIVMFKVININFNISGYFIVFLKYYFY